MSMIVRELIREKQLRFLLLDDAGLSGGGLNLLLYHAVFHSVADRVLVRCIEVVDGQIRVYFLNFDFITGFCWQLLSE